MLWSGCVPKAGWDISSTIKHTPWYTNIGTHKCTAVNGVETERKETHKLYWINIHKNRSVHKVMRHSLRQNIYAAENIELFQGTILYIHQLYDKTVSSKISVQLQRLIFSWLFLFCVLFSAVSVPECKTRQSWLQTVLSHRTTHHSPASYTFEAPWIEHAQWHTVNKLLVEALMAVAHLVRLCTDLESDQGPLAYLQTGQDKQKWERKTSWRTGFCIVFCVCFFFWKLWITASLKIKCWQFILC